MSNKIVTLLRKISNSFWYWLMYIAGGLVMLAIALYHQYGLDEMPCVLCIHTRLWVLSFMLVAITGLLCRKSRVMNSLAHVCITIIAAGLMYTSYQLLGTERGFILGACNFDLGLPGWLAVEQWVPWLFRVETTCGYTPEVAFGVTMAEALMLMSVTMFLLSLIVALASFSKFRTK